MWIFGPNSSHRWDINIDGIYKYHPEGMGREEGDEAVTYVLGEDEIAKYGYICITGINDKGDDESLFVCIDKEGDMDYAYDQFLDSIANHPHYVDLRRIENLRVADS